MPDESSWVENFFIGVFAIYFLAIAIVAIHRGGPLTPGSLAKDSLSILDSTVRSIHGIGRRVWHTFETDPESAISNLFKSLVAVYAWIFILFSIVLMLYTFVNAVPDILFVPIEVSSRFGLAAANFFKQEKGSVVHVVITLTTLVLGFRYLVRIFMKE